MEEITVPTGAINSSDSLPPRPLALWLRQQFIRRNGNLAAVALMLVLLQGALLVLVPAVESLVTAGTLAWRRLLIGNLVQWDTGWLLHIAREGYTNLADTAFFPLYPLVVRLAHRFTGIGFAVSGVALSLFFFLIAIYVLGLWLFNQFGLRTAYLGMALLVFFPTSFYFRAAYTESMFLAFVLLAVYASSRGHFVTAGIVTSFASLTRNTGLFVCAILVVDYVYQRNMGLQFWTREWWQRIDRKALVLVLPPLTFAGYLLWLQSHTGHAFAFMLAQQYWHRTYLPPWRTLMATLWQLIENHQPSVWPYHAYEFAAWLFAFAGLLLGLKYLRQPHHRGNALYLLLVLWVCTSAPARTGVHLHHWDYLLSMPRFDLTLFPAFAYMANRLRKKFWIALTLGVSISGLCLLYSLFCMGDFLA